MAILAASLCAVLIAVHRRLALAGYYLTCAAGATGISTIIISSLHARPNKGSNE